MRNRMKKYLSLFSLVTLSACGSSPSNNQGVSFMLTGFYAETSDGTNIPAGEVGQSVPLSSINPEDITGLFGGSVLTVAGLRNNMSTQTIRVDRMEMDYFIEGAATQPPSTIVPLTAVLGPVSSGNSSASSGSSSSAGTTGGALPTQFFAQFPIVTTDIMAWLNFNRGSLPELPFTMAVTVKAEAVSSSGSRYESNPASYFIIFTPDNIISPTDGGN